MVACVNRVVVLHLSSQIMPVIYVILIKKDLITSQTADWRFFLFPLLRRDNENWFKFSAKRGFDCFSLFMFALIEQWKNRELIASAQYKTSWAGLGSDFVSGTQQKLIFRAHQSQTTFLSSGERLLLCLWLTPEPASDRIYIHFFSPETKPFH